MDRLMIDVYQEVNDREDKLLWVNSSADSEEIDRIAEHFSVPHLLVELLWKRGFHTLSEIAEFLAESPSYSPPDDFLDMNLACQIIAECISSHQPIVVVGDYDVDGVTATTILTDALERLGAKVVCWIPHRVEDGYGLQVKHVEKAVQLEASLLITVDNGIRAIEAVKTARLYHLPVIVTDHHEHGEELPIAHAIVHYIRHRNAIVAKRLSGAGVALKLAAALHNGHIENEWIALASLGALADVMPMLGENRRLIKDGLQVLSQWSHAGWRALLHVAGLPEGESITLQQLLWRMIPRLNAAGRMDSADIAFRLLHRPSSEEAKSLAETIESLNRERKSWTEIATAAAIEQYQNQLENARGIVVWGEWPLGVVGIVAARLAEKFQSPAIVFANNGQHLLRGSGRSYGNDSLLAILESCQETLHHFGGHDYAVGCAVERHQLEAFRRQFQSTVKNQAKDRHDVHVPLTSDGNLMFREATPELAHWLTRLQPYGNGFKSFCFYMGPVELIDMQWIGKEQNHLRFTVRDEEATIGQWIWFQAPKICNSWHPGDCLGAIVEIVENQWQGQKRVQIHVKNAWRHLHPLRRQEISKYYHWFSQQSQIDKQNLHHWQKKLPRLNLLMSIFCELGFAVEDATAYYKVQVESARKIRDSFIYQQHLIENMEIVADTSSLSSAR
ncbi:single-stranded-DNA-specific exonuclease RecJ [Alicyclobacillus tolerans]|uniref:Single-stranded-DNA-specific exonuclease RecJ n=1 Tax=Alicyclobacillus tolerans TaxID=90970 RepID=A0ABT9LSN5_9BACL|nr:single-stranded-DNA-specific exonuclease RecJ [Alicyclobacillus tengchongensis]MDP9727275.1 single-stranded-DNA-specific exonuclease [Alicyclobacillus tengchongensis]